MWDRIIGAQLASAGMVAGTQADRHEIRWPVFQSHLNASLCSSCSPNFQCGVAVLYYYVSFCFFLLILHRN
ncbi:hypothetical protein ASPBRDRAFT_578847 [Aspergillus brasiliensis CBS 101740]|uniref:Uncharacterized protein n=1 Tax=Aspergillus brasiliensis (strain CBS 101740 / IMI 381727 / IBT 21946) TaxID=767769 RepID=A0A1L9UJM6_ASPBC|nr:hypothetical protein ASPBRDRAFT_578847 [Aspergillus brasiliensis CBS 101740]